MTIVKHELRLGRKAWIIWSASVSFLLVVCIFLFPEMKGEMDNISTMFSDMGSFTAAFGMAICKEIFNQSNYGILDLCSDMNVLRQVVKGSFIKSGLKCLALLILQQMPIVLNLLLNSLNLSV